MSNDTPLSRRTVLQGAGTAAGIGLLGSGAASLSDGATPTDPTDTTAVEGTTDWPQFQGNAAKTGVAGGGPTASSVRWEYDPDAGYGQPAILDGTVYAAFTNEGDDSTDGGLVALTSNGEERWRFRTDTDTELLSGPSVMDGLVFAGGRVFGDDCPSDERGALLLAVDAETGEEVYRRLFDGPVSSDPTVADGTVYTVVPNSAIVEEGLLLAHEAASGEELWRVSTGPTGIAGHTSPPVAVADGQVYLPRDGLVALDAATGEELWTSAADRLKASSLANVPAVAGETVYVGGGYEDGFYAISTDDGTIEWTYESEVFGAAAVTDDTVYVPVHSIDSAQAGIYALAADDGSEQWVTGSQSLPVLRPPIRGDEYLYVGPTALSVDDGSVAWTVAGGHNKGAVAGDSLYLGGESLVAVGGG